MAVKHGRRTVRKHKLRDAVARRGDKYDVGAAIVKLEVCGGVEHVCAEEGEREWFWPKRREVTRGARGDHQLRGSCDTGKAQERGVARVNDGV